MNMRRKILILSLLAVAAVWLFWPLGEHAVAPVAKSPVAPAPKISAVPAAATNHSALAAVQPAPSAVSATNRFPFRLSNTPKTIGELTARAHAILLENALIDTELKPDLSIPKHLRADAEPGAYIVQARGAIGAAFRTALAGAGAEIVSYIPNNAYLVRLSAAGAAGLSANSLVQTVLPYAPYFKVQSGLLDRAVNQKSLPEGTDLTLGIFAGGAAATEAAIQKLGAKIVARDRTPFGSMVRVQPAQEWIALAQLPGVQLVELARDPKPANDLARVTLGVAADTTTTANYLNLTGSNVVVEVNDTGVDTNHPDFFGRLTLDNLGSGYDTVGHGTHVAGIIAGSGFESPTVTFASGSLNPGVASQYRGKASAASVYALKIPSNPNGSFRITNSYVQEQPVKAKALISNNSWGASGAGYDLTAASFDAAVRDAVPTNPAPQPVLFVFSAGNDGGGNDNGAGGYSDSVASPGTAKNVITVGALEQFRHITNLVMTYYDGFAWNSNGVPDEYWYPMTDTNNQVASYSSRGNVGVGTEGTYGRFKPDVVAPGSMVVSTRSANWDTNAYYGDNTFYHYFPRYYQTVDTNYDNFFTFFVPPNAIRVAINITANLLTTLPLPDLNVYVSTNAAIDPLNPSTYQFNLTNNTITIPPDGPANYLQSVAANGHLSLLVTDPTIDPVDYDIVVTITTTNDNNYSLVLQGMNSQLGPWYRYESGTSMAAPAVSGTLALMQDYFTNTLHLIPSPVLLKAMLINGARPTGGNIYALNQDNNLQGWGLPELTNSIPNNLNSASSPLYFLDQSPTNVLATGDSRTFIVQPGISTQPLRITLAWTDPPGNPAAAVKLVNNLDLVVTNLTTGEIYYGNNFDVSANPTFSLASATNDAPVFDLVNNVENVFIAPGLGARYSVTVIGRNVNVNAVTTVATNIVQDYALVVSLGDNSISSSVTVSPVTNAPVGSITPQLTDLGGSSVSYVNNLIEGANDPVVSTNVISFGTNTIYATNAVLYIGQTNQWRFFVISNALASNTNVAFSVSGANTLSVSRLGVLGYGADAPDLDIYVATYPSDTNAFNLTNLNSQVISNCIQGLNGDGAALSRSATEVLLLTNALLGNVYYVGVKCENQMGASYEFVHQFNPSPPDEQGNQVLTGLPASIPDGSNPHPGYTNIVVLATTPTTVKRVVVTNTITHQNYGDLYSRLNHNNTNVYLNNHDGFGAGTFTVIYDDSDERDITGSVHTDGPGSLMDYEGGPAIGPWHLTVVDNATNHIGTNNFFSMKIEPKATNTAVFRFRILPGQWTYIGVDVPSGFTNLFVIGMDIDGYPGLKMAVAAGFLPTLPNNWDQGVVLNQPFGNYYTNYISTGPPLPTGMYIIGVYNPDINPHTCEVDVNLTYPYWSTQTVPYTSVGTVPLLDDAVTLASNTLSRTGNAFVGINVGLRVNHPRISDLVFHLIGPGARGPSYLVMENRGNNDTNGCGYTGSSIQTGSGTSSGGPAESTKIIDTGTNNGTITINYQMYSIPDRMVVYNGTNVWDTGYVSGANTLVLNYSNSTIITIVMNPGGGNSGPVWDYTYTAPMADYHYLTLTDDTNLTTTPIKFAPTPFVPATATNLYYQPERPLSDGGFTTNNGFLPPGLDYILTPLSEAGTWTLEVLDNRAGATSLAPELLSWQIGFKYVVQLYAYLQGFIGRTDQVPANSTVWFEVFVPSNASFATNILNSATGPVNLWFSTSTPPAASPGTNDTMLLTNSTAGIGLPVLTTNSVPPLPGGLYFLGVENTNAFAVTFSLEVDFDHGNPLGSGGPASVKFASAKVTASGPKLQWNRAPGSHYQIQWKDSLTAPWNTITNPSVTTSNGASDFIDDGSQTAPVTGQRFYRLVWVP